MKALVLCLTLLATPALSDRLAECAALGEIAERMAIARDAGFSRRMAILAVPTDIDPQTYFFLLDAIDLIYGDLRYEPPQNVGTGFYRACMQN